MENTRKSLEPENKTVSIKREFTLPKNTIWKAWTEPESFKKWWGPIGYSCPFCTIDLRVGGKYLASMKGPEGKEQFSTGTYKEIIPGKKLVMTDSWSDSKGNITGPPEGMPGSWPEALLIIVELEEKNGKTSLSMNQEGVPAEVYEDCIQGWQQCLDKMEKI